MMAETDSEESDAAQAEEEGAAESEGEFHQNKRVVETLEEGRSVMDSNGVPSMTLYTRVRNIASVCLTVYSDVNRLVLRNVRVEHVRDNYKVATSQDQQMWCMEVMEEKLFVNLVGLRAFFLLTEMVDHMFGQRIGPLLLSHAGTPPYGHTTVRGWEEAGWKLAVLLAYAVPLTFPREEEEAILPVPVIEEGRYEEDMVREEAVDEEEVSSLEDMVKEEAFDEEEGSSLEDIIYISSDEEMMSELSLQFVPIDSESDEEFFHLYMSPSEDEEEQ